MSIESKNIPPSDLKTYEAILRYYAFSANFSEETFFKAFEALKLAVAKEPEKGIVWSMLARLYATNYALELFDVKHAAGRGRGFAAKRGQARSGQPAGSIDHGYTMLLKNDLSAWIGGGRTGHLFEPELPDHDGRIWDTF